MHRDKRCPECTDCEKRIVYAEYIEKREHDIPFIRALKPTVNTKETVMEKKQEPIAVPTKTKTCRECGRTGPVGEMFGKNVKSRDGYLHLCKECFGNTHTLSTREKNVNNTDNGRVVQITMPESAYQRLSQVAHQQLRTMGNQLLYCFVQAYPEDDE